VFHRSSSFTSFPRERPLATRGSMTGYRSHDGLQIIAC
jgi:hypothetical protein